MLLKNTMRIRRATEQDREIVQEMIMKADEYHIKTCPTFAKAVRKNPELHYKKSTTLIDRIDISTFYLLEVFGKTIGSIMVWDNKGETTLTNFYIDEEYRGKGYGRTLLKHVIKNMHTSYCVLSVFEENKKSLDFYLRFGFKYMQIEESDSGRILWLQYVK